MKLAARLGYILGTMAVGAVAGLVLLGNKTKSAVGSRPAPPVEKLAEELGAAWAPYHNR